MSLLEISGRVELVSWTVETSSKKLMGKFVESIGAVWKYPTPGTKPSNLSAGVPVIWDTKIRMDKPKSFRQRLPDSIVRLKLLWEVGMASRLGSSAASLQACCLCGGPCELQCVFCLMAWHQSCCTHVKHELMQARNKSIFERILSENAQSVSYPTELLPRLSLPASMCAVCGAFLRL